MKTGTLRGLILVIAHTFDGTQAQIEGNVVGGDFATITNFPHSVFLSVLHCSHDNAPVSWICGSSILNQHFIITAGHCLEACNRKSKIFVIYGHENKNKGAATRANKFKIHENYNTYTMHADIAIVSVETPFKFNNKIKRVMIHWNTPVKGTAYIAGWGLIDENKGISSTRLKYVKQTLWTRAECMKVLGDLPSGTICAGHIESRHFVSEGDSGSALVMRDYIQVGIVSYKIPTISVSLTVYTEVGYYYNWIATNTKRLFCN